MKRGQDFFRAFLKTWEEVRGRGKSLSGFLALLPDFRQKMRIQSIPLQNSRGVALLAALFVLMVMSILSIGMLANVDEDIKISKNIERSERALKVAEAGLQIARSTFFNSAERSLNTEDTRQLNSVNGYIHGGYFLAQLTSGFSGQERWTQWRYDIGLSGNNQESEITAPLRRVWATSSSGTNGSWSQDQSDGTWRFYAQNLYGIVATGVYFPIEGTNNTNVRAHHEYTGKRNIWDAPDEDRSIIQTNNSKSDVTYAVKMSPMTTYTEYNTDNVRTAQIIYYTYSGANSDNGDLTSSTADTTSTVRLRAADALSAAPSMSVQWEFNTGIHGIGTAPAMIELDPKDDPTDTNNDPTRLIYFTVVSMGSHRHSSQPSGQTQNKDLNGIDNHDITSYPSDAKDFPDQLYLFAVIDYGNGSYRVKWNRPFPDPDVAEWTDYPSEHATGTNGYSAPYVSRPSDIRTYLPEDDLLADYRDGPGGLIANSYGSDSQWNQIRGNVFAAQGTDPSVSPVIVNVLYQKSDGSLTDKREDPDLTDAQKLNPILDIYVMYSVNSRVAFYRQTPNNAPDTRHNFGQNIQDIDGNPRWGDPGFRKANATQTRIMSLRDYLVRNDGTWDWNDPRSLFPEFKWTYRVPGHDPDPTDAIPADGYGEYSWDAWFAGQIAPMIMNHTNDSNDRDGDGRRGDDDDGGTKFSDITKDGTKNMYPVLYPYFKSTGFTTGSGHNNNNGGNAGGPADGAPADFSQQGWLDARIMMQALRDTWDDYINGRQTNILYPDDPVAKPPSNANPEPSNPVEPYWYYSAYDASSGPKAEDHKYRNGQTTVYYNQNQSHTDEAGQPLNAPYPSGVMAGAPRPYTWSESLWNQNVREAAAGTEYSLYDQGWRLADVGTLATLPASGDADIEAETAAICKSCLREEGLIVLPFNHDLTLTMTDDTGSLEDLRLHGINSRTGLHIWDYHIAASLAGDNANSTPALGNNKVFVAYMMFNAENNPNNRKALITVLDANDGSPVDEDTEIDNDADAVILSPTIANGMAYVATYDFNGTVATDNDAIRLYAMSPMVRLVATGIYPAPTHGDQNLNIDTNASDAEDKLKELNYVDIFKDEDRDYATKRVRSARRRIQVWISGDSSRWQEVKEEIDPALD